MGNKYTEHVLKLRSEFFEDVVYERKKFEVRKNDRDYKVGDKVIFREYGCWGYTGKEITRYISYILTSEQFPDGLKEGYCVFGLTRIPGAVVLD